MRSRPSTRAARSPRRSPRRSPSATTPTPSSSRKPPQAARRRTRFRGIAHRPHRPRSVRCSERQARRRVTPTRRRTVRSTTIAAKSSTMPPPQSRRRRFPGRNNPTSSSDASAIRSRTARAQASLVTAPRTCCPPSSRASSATRKSYRARTAWTARRRAIGLRVPAISTRRSRRSTRRQAVSPQAQRRTSRSCSARTSPASRIRSPPRPTRRIWRTSSRA